MKCIARNIERFEPFKGHFVTITKCFGPATGDLAARQVRSASLQAGTGDAAFK